MIQLGGLVEKSGLAGTLGLTIGADLQKDDAMEKPAAILLGALVLLERELQGDVHSLEMLYELGKKHMATESNTHGAEAGAQAP